MKNGNGSNIIEDLTSCVNNLEEAMAGMTVKHVYSFIHSCVVVLCILFLLTLFKNTIGNIKQEVNHYR